MFDSDLTITGRPANYIKFLVNEAHAFQRRTRGRDRAFADSERERLQNGGGGAQDS